MKSLDSLVTLGSLAAEQWGMFTSAQAQANGITKMQIARLVDAGLISRVRHGVYRITAVPSTPFDQIRAEWLSFKPELMAYERYNNQDDFVAIGTTALELFRAGEFFLDQLQFAHPNRYQSRQPGVRISRRKINRSQIQIQEGIPTLRIELVIYDLAKVGYDIGSLAKLSREVHKSEFDLSRAWVGRRLSPHHKRLLAEVTDLEQAEMRYREQSKAHAPKKIAA